MDPNQPDDPPADDDRAVQSIPLDTEDGGQVVISQQASGRQNAVGGGEFPDPHEPTTVEEAARQQDELDEGRNPDGSAADSDLS